MFPPGGRREAHETQGSQNATGLTWAQSKVTKAEMNAGTGRCTPGNLPADHPESSWGSALLDCLSLTPAGQAFQ